MRDCNRSYADRWFWTHGALAQAVGVSEAVLDEMIAAGCAPGAIYASAPDGPWWSALGAVGTEPPRDAQRWYSPAAAWWLRRATILVRSGQTLAAASAANRLSFIDGFVEGLSSIPDAAAAFGHCFDSAGDVIESAARTAGEEEYNAWLQGGYAICLRIFTAETVIRKEALKSVLKRRLEGAELTFEEQLDFLARAETLALLILPFSPDERPIGTPGLTIDRFLAQYALGEERPYA